MHPKAIIHIAGQRFGRTVALRLNGNNPRGHVLWECQCDCGTVHGAVGSSLVNGDVRSCGCLLRDYQRGLPRVKQLVGQVFGRLTVVAFAGKDKKRQALWKCKCECGKEHVTAGTYLATGHSKSCGCLQPEVASKHCKANFTDHGITRTLTGVSWAAMMQRCLNPKVVAWPDYGGRGIRPCEFFQATPLNLVCMIGFRPSKEVSLDRINPALGYTCGTCGECIAHGWPLNVRWSTRLQQNRNKRRTQLVEIGGETKTIGEWAEQWGVGYCAARYRISKHRREVKETVIAYEI